MSESVYPENSIPAPTEPGAGSDNEPDTSLLEPTFEVDAPEFYDPTLGISSDAKNEEEEESEASRKDEENEEASAPEKELPDQTETTDDLSVSVSNDTDSTTEETHGRGLDRAKEGTEVSAKMILLMPFKAGVIKIYETGKQLIEKLKGLTSFDPHRTAEAEAPAAENSTQKNPLQFATDSRIERSSSITRHNSEAEKETPESSEWAGFQDYHIVSPRFETTQPVTDFEMLPDLVLLQIFKWIGNRDRLRLEGVNKRWKELLIESWKDVRVLKLPEIFSPSLTDENIESLRKVCAKSLYFERPHESYRIIKVKEEDEDEWVIARKIFSSVTAPPCSAKKVVLGTRMIDRSTLLSLKRIGDQITSLRLEVEGPHGPEEPIEDMDGRSFFDYFPNLISLTCHFPGVYCCTRQHYIRKCWASLPTSIEYLCLECWETADDALGDFFNMEEPLCSLRQLELSGFYIRNTANLGGLALRFPNLEMLDISAHNHNMIGLEFLVRQLKNLRVLILHSFHLDVGFLSHALSFAFREKLETCCISSDPFQDVESLPQEYLENISHFPNLKTIIIMSAPRGRVELNVDGIEKIAKGCRKLQRICLEPCQELNNDALGILGAYCPDLQSLKLAGCPHVTEEGIEALRSGLTNPNGLYVWPLQKRSSGLMEESEASESSESDDDWVSWCWGRIRSLLNVFQ